jgi:hypothetical protein
MTSSLVLAAIDTVTSAGEITPPIRGKRFRVRRGASERLFAQCGVGDTWVRAPGSRMLPGVIGTPPGA